jgi:hypothetical protein
VQTLVSPRLRAHYPDNHVIRAIGRSDKRRAATVHRVHAPGLNDHRWISGSKSKRSEHTTFGVKNHKRSRGSRISDRRLYNLIVGNMIGGYWRSDTTKVVAIHYKRVASLSHCHNQMRRGCTWNVHEDWA